MGWTCRKINHQSVAEICLCNIVHSTSFNPPLRIHQESQDRRDAIGFLFHTLDADGDQRLNLPELERFASMCGFSGEWQTEYEAVGRWWELGMLGGWGMLGWVFGCNKLFDAIWMGNTWETLWKSMRPFSRSHPLSNPLKKNDVDVAVFLGQKCGTCPQVMCEVLKIPSSKGVDFLQFNRLARHSMAWNISDIYRFFPHFRIYI